MHMYAYVLYQKKGRKALDSDLNEVIVLIGNVCSSLRKRVIS